MSQWPLQVLLRQGTTLSNRMFLLKDAGICNFADDTTANVCDENLENVLKSHEKNSVLAICWFENKFMNFNTEKCHLIIPGYKHE